MDILTPEDAKAFLPDDVSLPPPYEYEVRCLKAASTRSLGHPDVACTETKPNYATTMFRAAGDVTTCMGCALHVRFVRSGVCARY